MNDCYGISIIIQHRTHSHSIGFLNSGQTKSMRSTKDEINLRSLTTNSDRMNDSLCVVASFNKIFPVFSDCKCEAYHFRLTDRQWTGSVIHTCRLFAQCRKVNSKNSVLKSAHESASATIKELHQEQLISISNLHSKSKLEWCNVPFEIPFQI